LVMDILLDLYSFLQLLQQRITIRVYCMPITYQVVLYCEAAGFV
jgi:hypothetical protein